MRKIIWQVCESLERLPEEYSKCRRSWEESNPEWRIELVTNSESRALFVDYLPEYLDVFDSLPLGVMKADMWRYAVLMIHGGIYADVDTYCCVPITTWLSPEDEDMLHICCEEATPWFCQWAIYAPAKHPALKAVIDLIAERVGADCGVNIERPDCVHHYTGPDAWSEAVKRTLGSELSTSGILADRALAGLGRVIIHPTGFFADQVIRHGYASFSWTDNGYNSWRDNIRTKLMAKSKPHADRLKELLIPRICDNLKRYGGECRGTFVLGEMILRESAYLVSLGNDELFDQDVASAGTEVITADLEISRDPLIGLEEVVNLSERAFSNLPDYDPSLILRGNMFSLKINVEGSEYRLLRDCPQVVLDRCAQLAIKFHNLPNGGGIEEGWRVRESVVNKLLETYYLVYLRSGKHSELIHGFPDVLECLFIHKKMFDREPDIWKTSSPLSGMDFPHQSGSPELTLDWWTGGIAGNPLNGRNCP